MGSLFLPPYQTTLDANANAISGAKLYFYVSGTSTPTPAYAESTLATELTNPVIADNAGRYPAIYLDSAITYRVRIADAGGTTIRDIDPYTVSDGGGTATANFDEVDTAAYPRLAGETSDFPRLIRTRDAAFLVGKGIFASPGVYEKMGENGQNFDPTLTGFIKTGLRLRGVRGKTIFQQDPDLPYCLYGNPAGIGTPEMPNTISYSDPTGIRDVEISGITIVTDVVGRGFAEQHAQIHINGVGNARIHHNDLIGARGDGIYVGAGDIGGGGQNRHNDSVLIEDNLFDGINNNNRNPWTFIDGTKCAARRNDVRGFTKPGGGGTVPYDVMVAASGLQMPGPDVEPNSFTDDPRINDITVEDNKFTDCGGEMTLFLLFNEQIPTPINNLFVRRNVSTRCRSNVAIFAQPNCSIPYNIVVEDNDANTCVRAHFLRSGTGIIYRNNRHRSCTFAGEIGYQPTETIFDTVWDFDWIGNLYEGCGSDGIGAVAVVGMNRWRQRANIFRDNSGYGWTFRKPGVTTSGLREGNVFESTAGAPIAPAKSQTLSVGVLTFSGVPLIDNPSCVERGEVYNDQPTFGVQMEGSFVTSPPASGLWPLGKRVNGYKLPRGEPEYWRSRGNTSGTPIWDAQLSPGGLPTLVGAAGETTSGMTLASGRFTNTAGGVQWGRSTSTINPVGAQGVEMIVQMPVSGTDGVIVGIATDAAFATMQALANFKYALWPQMGLVRGYLAGASAANPTFGTSFLNVQYRLQYFGGVVRIRRMNPDTGVWEDPGGGDRGVTALTANVRVLLYSANKGDTLTLVSFTAITGLSA